MKDIRKILSDLNSGSVKVSEIPDELILQLSSSMLIEQLEGPDELLSRLSRLQRDVLGLQSLLVEGDIAKAVIISEDLLFRSRSKEERDLECEVRIRMERALLAVDGSDASGQELRWCSERLKAIAPNTALHGISMLNQANWHSNNGEIMMAMAIHAEITKDSGFPDEIRGLSRLEVGRILTAMDDLDPAMRHLWTARAIFIQAEMEAEAVVVSLEWLDLALEEVTEDAPRMLYRIENAEPRSVPGSSWVPANEQDVRDVVESIFSILTEDVGGTERTDLGIILDAAEILGEQEWKNSLLEKSKDIQDARLLEALQS
ncbi:MAG: hypothetical protein MKZ53_05510 [Candidatus Thalassarchaeum sp.]|jgi:hypothetical protein|nr:hypothetical protein [Candidatus Thalassarchaeum sp.]GIS49679.1 MAG: hypothetical protein Ct9H90mP23_3510 [Euryarchaeota archaeon]|tara:strand:+ start:8913 stop:9863 length:951 start_codon:yes stop_codon:yes gene_type:complete